MKKTNNKGFSLVELIIVIAIMAILAGAIAPALIKYIDNSRKSNDVSSCDTIKTAINTVLGNEYAYELLTSGTAANVTPTHATTSGAVSVTSKIVIKPAETTAASGVVVDAMGGQSSDTSVTTTTVAQLIFDNIGEKTPKIKYKKAADSSVTPDCFVAWVSAKGTVYVGMGIATDKSIVYEVVPEVCNYYQ